MKSVLSKIEARIWSQVLNPINNVVNDTEIISSPIENMIDDQIYVLVSYQVWGQTTSNVYKETNYKISGV